jgi:enterochelin esterase-like enzyme
MFYSPALHRRADYLVYLPPGYGGDRRRYAAYYLLHGSPGRPQVYLGIASMPVRMDNLISRHRMHPMILVFPDGRIRGSTYSDSEWANTRSGRYASFVIDVMHDVDRRFRTIANRRDRVIAGFSAGAYGATNVLLHNIASFANLQSWSGYYVEPRTGVFARASAAALAANSPLDYVHRLAGAIARDPVRAFLFVGRDDNDSTQIKPMAQALAAAGASVSYALYHGGHDWQLWHAHLNQLLILASRDTSAPLRRGGGFARTLTPGVVLIPRGEGRRHRRPRRPRSSATIGPVA